MSILNTHNHRLVFCIDDDAPEEYIKRWNEFKFKCEGGKNKHIVEQIKEYCNLETNKALSYLNRMEGGLGGDNNTIHKQLRFRNSIVGINDNHIIFDQVMNTDIEKWTYNELDDLIYAFTKTANYNVKAKCVSGYIEMKNNDSYSDNYLDSDSEYE
jgi:hypothetical protein